MSKAVNLGHPGQMKKYIGQLLHAKAVCEKRLREIGCEVLHGIESELDSSQHHEPHLGQRVTFENVMKTPFTR